MCEALNNSNASEERDAVQGSEVIQPVSLDVRTNGTPTLGMGADLVKLNEEHQGKRGGTGAANFGPC